MCLLPYLRSALQLDPSQNDLENHKLVYGSCVISIFIKVCNIDFASILSFLVPIFQLLPRGPVTDLPIMALDK